eukprot:355002-Chlamydomonas_euryale.AAC.2
MWYGQSKETGNLKHGAHLMKELVTNVTIPGLAAYYALLVSKVPAMRERAPQVCNASRHPFDEIVNRAGDRQ